MLTFQQIIQRLTEFWEKQGCIIHHGYDVEVGAGTFNPATFLRCLGPEPYRTAYVEPSRRPKDARYGENPNRVQLFHQFQVIIKPSPLEIQKTYLQSLQAVGLDLKKHDIRFVHDDWESPTLGAWGLGWEVWCDGMEVTQYTYFQAVGSQTLKPISVELTYGLERLALFIQNKDSIFHVQWNEEFTFQEISKRSEFEWSTYNFEESSIAMWQRHFEDFEKEAKRLISCNLPLPAYDFVMKASHAFNMLDARGAISVTERTGYIGRIRELSRLIAAAYVSSRETLGFPLLAKQKIKKEKPLPPFKIPAFDPRKKQDFLLEIGSEQLPATFVPIGCRELKQKTEQLLQTHGLIAEEVKVFGTPRRLSVFVRNLCEGVCEKLTIRRGPAVATAFDSSGNLQPQGKGFFKSVGKEEVTLDLLRQRKNRDIYIELVKDVEYLVATIKTPAISTFALLAEHLPKLISDLQFPKKMRWGDGDLSYARPVHWIVALFGTQVIPMQWGEIISGRTSYGHAQLNNKPFSLTHPKHYLQLLKKHHVLADIHERRQHILKQLKKIEAKYAGEALEKEAVMDEVVHLTEWPQLTTASFDENFLKAPKEVLISEMVEHQRYFPFADKDGNLKNLFVITADIRPTELIRKGNTKVLSARLSDGVFLYEQDKSVPLEQFNEKLRAMTYQKELGSMFDKVERIVFISAQVNNHLKVADSDKLKRAALLSKADLASALVGEFPKLQGTVGTYYALAQGEERDVAEAIAEHWMPRAEHAPLPQTGVGVALSIADKLDNLLSCYSVGLKPTSSSDPYALRRQTIGLLRMLIEQKKRVDLKKLLEDASFAFPKLNQDPENKEKILQEMLQFITARSKTVFEEYCGMQRDEIEACLLHGCTDPFDHYCKIQALHTFRHSSEQFPRLLEVYKRAKGQLDQNEKFTFSAALATEDAERELMQALQPLEKEWKVLLSQSNYLEAFQLLATLQKPLAHLFDTVKILADDPQLRTNRVALLQIVFGYFKELLDFTHLT